MAEELRPIYLDYNATTPLDPLVAQAMSPYLQRDFGNPSSAHAYGAAAKKAVEQARAQVAEMLGCRLEEVVFTSGGTESNNMAIAGVAHAYRHKGNHIIASQVEHPAVIEVCRSLEAQGFAVTYLPVTVIPPLTSLNVRFGFTFVFENVYVTVRLQPPDPLTVKRMAPVITPLFRRNFTGLPCTLFPL